jgi:hypothetical protein
LVVSSLKDVDALEVSPWQVPVPKIGDSVPQISLYVQRGGLLPKDYYSIWLKIKLNVDTCWFFSI